MIDEKNPVSSLMENIKVLQQKRNREIMQREGCEWYEDYIIEYETPDEELMAENVIKCDNCGEHYLTYYTRNWKESGLNGWLCPKCFSMLSGLAVEHVPFNWDRDDFCPLFFEDEDADIEELEEAWFNDWDTNVACTNPGYGFMCGVEINISK